MKTIQGIHANRGIEARYRKQLLSLIAEMGESVEYWLQAGYKLNPPTIAQDATPAAEMKKRLQELRKRWLKKIDESAPKIADAYVRGMFNASSTAMRSALKQAGWTVKFRMTASMRDAYDATIVENVGLIKSIPEQYLQQVEGAVMRAYTRGRDLEGMLKAIRKIHHVTEDRGILIARDQSNKANATVNAARQLDLGITEGIWQHSHGGKVPRPEHVAADGKRFKLAKGCLIGGKYVMPGEEINCRCVWRAVLPV